MSVQDCPHCHTPVIRSPDRICPSCRKSIDEPSLPPMVDFTYDSPVEPTRQAAPEISTANTVLPRHIAAIMDNLIAMTLGFVAAKSVNDDMPVLQIAALVASYLGYYLLFECLISRTPAKLLTGLVVVRYDGRRCTLRQALIRTVFRIFEVNPAFFGGIPAAVSIVVSEHHQRLGDIVARTVVVPSRRVRKR